MSDDLTIRKEKIQELARVSDRISFLYVEHAKINRQDNSITVTDNRGKVTVPVAIVNVLLLGPGVDVTHRAMELMGDCGMAVCWTATDGIKQYAHGRALSHSTIMLQQQAIKFANNRSRLDIVRQMYSMRFPDEDASKYTAKQLRGKEGNHVNQLYKDLSLKYDVEWHKRQYVVDDYSSLTPINKALTTAHQCMYGLSYAVICALGVSPGLGFLHCNNDLSFVYDFADLYNETISIPIAFQAARQYQDNPDLEVGAITKILMREAFRTKKLTKQMVNDLQLLFTDKNNQANFDADVIYLWDNRTGLQKAGVQYQDFDNNVG